MISVIIPTYNRAEPVIEAVESVLAQRDVPQGLEIIVVDDGSTDGTREALGRFSEGIRYIRRPHGGVSAARNQGIAESRGEYIAFLDSDDLWLPGKLSAQMRYFYENPEAVLCQTEEIWMRGGKRLNPRKHHKKPEGRCFPLLLERCLVSPSAVVIRRDLFDTVGLFDESLPACEDYDLWLRIGCRHPLGLIETPLTIKRGGRPDQLSATVPALDRYRVRSIIKLLCAGSLDAAQTGAAMRVFEEKCRIYAEGCLRRGKTDEWRSVEILAREVLSHDRRHPSQLLALSDFLLS
ncbi:MAG: glycosyltransferase [Syntrophobacteraceae bacterium]